MKDKYAMPKARISRLSAYFHELNRMQKEGRPKVVSSNLLGKTLGFSQTQVRKDFAAFGEFGKKGVGYFVSDLILHISRILGLNQKWNIALLGAVRLDKILAHNRTIIDNPFKFQAVFDNDQTKLGKLLNGVEISHIDNLEKVIQEQNIHIAIILTPELVTQKLVNRLISSGIKGILNYTPHRLQVPDNFPLVNLNLSMGLSNLCYYIRNCEEETESRLADY